METGSDLKDRLKLIEQTPFDVSPTSVGTSPTPRILEKSWRCVDNLAGTVQVASVTFQPSGRFIAIKYYNQEIWVWNPNEKKSTRFSDGSNQRRISPVAFSPDGQFLASVVTSQFGQDEQPPKLWHIRAPRKDKNFAGKHPGIIYTLAFSPDNQTLATGDKSGVICLWAIASRRLIRQCTGHEGVVNSVAFSPNSKILASGGADGKIQIYDAASLVVLEKPALHSHSFEEHSGPVTSVAFSPDGKILASGSNDNTIKLWDVEARKEVSTLEGHSGPVTSVAFSPDGKLLASGSEDTTTRIWQQEA